MAVLPETSEEFYKETEHWETVARVSPIIVDQERYTTLAAVRLLLEEYGIDYNVLRRLDEVQFSIVRKHSRMLSRLSEQLHAEPSESPVGDILRQTTRRLLDNIDRDD